MGSSDENIEEPAGEKSHSWEIIDNKKKSLVLIKELDNGVQSEKTHEWGVAMVAGNLSKGWKPDPLLTGVAFCLPLMHPSHDWDHSPRKWPTSVCSMKFLNIFLPIPN